MDTDSIMPAAHVPSENVGKPFNPTLITNLWKKCGNASIRTSSISQSDPFDLPSRVSTFASTTTADHVFTRTNTAQTFDSVSTSPESKDYDAYNGPDSPSRKAALLHTTSTIDSPTKEAAPRNLPGPTSSLRRIPAQPDLRRHGSWHDEHAYDRYEAELRQQIRGGAAAAAAASASEPVSGGSNGQHLLRGSDDLAFEERYVRRITSERLEEARAACGVLPRLGLVRGMTSAWSSDSGDDEGEVEMEGGRGSGLGYEGLHEQAQHGDEDEDDTDEEQILFMAPLARPRPSEHALPAINHTQKQEQEQEQEQEPGLTPTPTEDPDYDLPGRINAAIWRLAEKQRAAVDRRIAAEEKEEEKRVEDAVEGWKASRCGPEGYMRGAGVVGGGSVRSCGIGGLGSDRRVDLEGCGGGGGWRGGGVVGW